ncbi:uncharacterized protein LOC105829602 isoform X4 [Monomorium pharaonis]|uniref:uncharacterized protein LOC105829602 isoform X4 n=1 Tax=Monomorium pharaonis TaxID=307658 RepID=UPI00063EEE04|nr:uncharacterized protein LOC105829602 isoform X4 [Monomorium pharaonis]
MDWNSKFQNPSTRIKMRFTILTLAATLCLALVSSHPLPEDSGLRSEDVNPESENRVNEIGSESQNNEVRVQFADEVPSENSPQELTPLDETETDEDENRNKRFLFGLGGGAGGAGSGNFLFDIIRLVAGSGSNSLGGSSGSPDHEKSDHEHEAVPGPVTRFFVIANRGLSNLVQDLILRLAATSERFVNFKARLITSII